MKTMSSEDIVQHLMGEKGLLKIYSLFNTSKASDVRKLAGRLVCEALYKSPKNQDFFCDLFDLDCTYGRVSINQNLPVLIKQKLASEPDFLFSLHSMGRLSGETTNGNYFHQTRSNSTPSSSTQAPAKRYWSFPEFKEISTTVLKSQRYSGGSDPTDLNKGPGARSHYQTSTSGVPTNTAADLDRLTQANREANESILEYVNFPDP